VTVYSHSRISSYENCPQQFAFRYVEKIQTDWVSVEAFLGRRVHEILERLYHHVRRHGRPPSLAQVQERYRRDWHDQWHPQVRIVREENGVEHYLRYGEQCLGHYYRSHYPFDAGETVGMEQELQIALDDSGRYRMRGIVDRVVRTGEGAYEVHDYKTSGSLPPLSRLARDRQLALYQIGLEQTYADVQEVELVWHYLGFNKTMRVRRTQEELVQLRQDTIARIDEIEAATAYPARPSALCRWCDYAELCPAAGGRTRIREPEITVPPPVAPAATRGQLALF
jgi:putative RecB family exonuclease